MAGPTFQSAFSKRFSTCRIQNRALTPLKSVSKTHSEMFVQPSRNLRLGEHKIRISYFCSSFQHLRLGAVKSQMWFCRLARRSSIAMVMSTFADSHRCTPMPRFRVARSPGRKRMDRHPRLYTTKFMPPKRRFLEDRTYLSEWVFEALFNDS